MLTLIGIDGGYYTFIDTVTYKTHKATSEQVLGLLNSKKVSLNGVMLYEYNENTRYIKTTYQVLREGLFILNKIDDIGYIVCNSDGKIMKLDNLTCIAYARINMVCNIDILKGVFSVRGYYGLVKASDIGIRNMEGVNVQSNKYTGKKIGWVDVLQTFGDSYSSYKFENNKLIKTDERGSSICGSMITHHLTYIALCRDINNKGVRYKVHNAIKGTKRVVTLESIYEYYKDYSNVYVNGDIIRIASLDGVYEYDMSLIYKEYGTARVQSETAMKAGLLGIDYTESLDTQYNLHRLSSTAENLTIPLSTKHIMGRSINISRENKLLFFPESLETCNINCFDRDRSIEYNIEHIGIATTGEARLQIIKALNSKLWVLKKEVILEFRSELTPYEFGYLIMSNLVIDRECMIQCTNVERMTDSFIESVINSIIDVKFNNFNLINRPMDIEVTKECGRIISTKQNNEYNRLKKDFKIFKHMYKSVLKNSASASLNKRIREFIGQLDNTFRVMDIEINKYKRIS